MKLYVSLERKRKNLPIGAISLGYRSMSFFYINNRAELERVYFVYFKWKFFSSVVARTKDCNVLTSTNTLTVVTGE